MSKCVVFVNCSSDIHVCSTFRLQPAEPLSNDYLFPMSNRLSYASSPESDVEQSRPHSMYDGGGGDDGGGDFSPPMQRRRLVRASSDPSLTTADNVPGIPPYNAPPIYHGAPPPVSAAGSRYVSAHAQPLVSLVL